MPAAMPCGCGGKLPAGSVTSAEVANQRASAEFFSTVCFGDFYCPIQIRPSVADYAVL
jgi:hypothetical protein